MPLGGHSGGGGGNEGDREDGEGKEDEIKAEVVWAGKLSKFKPMQPNEFVTKYQIDTHTHTKRKLKETSTDLIINVNFK